MDDGQRKAMRAQLNTTFNEGGESGDPILFHFPYDSELVASGFLCLKIILRSKCLNCLYERFCVRN